MEVLKLKKMEKVIDKKINLKNHLKQNLTNIVLQSALLTKRLTNLHKSFEKNKFHLKNKGKTQYQNFFKTAFKQIEINLQKYTEDLYLNTIDKFLSEFGQGDNELFVDSLKLYNEEDSKITKQLIYSEYSVSWILSKSYLGENLDLLRPVEKEEEDVDAEEEGIDNFEMVKQHGKLEKDTIGKVDTGHEGELDDDQTFANDLSSAQNILEETEGEAECKAGNDSESENESIPESISIIDLIQKHKIVTKSYKAKFSASSSRNFQLLFSILWLKY